MASLKAMKKSSTTKMLCILKTMIAMNPKIQKAIEVLVSLQGDLALKGHEN